MRKDEYSMTKPKLKDFGTTQQNIVNIVFKKRTGRNQNQK